MPYLFTSESVSEGHPDKVADQISDALIDHFLAFDPNSKVACETLVTTGQVVLAGEVKSKAYLDVQEIARSVIRRIGYTKSEYMFEAHSCGVLSAIHEQSADINQGVDRKKKEEQGAGDQGMMFGYATSETENYMPLALDLAHKILIELSALRKENKQINFIGNIKKRDFFNNKANVMVCDGFTNNIVLKMAESFYDLAKERGLDSDPYLSRFHYENYGGTPVLGVAKPVIIGHGISSAKAFSNMISLAEKMIASNICTKMADSFQASS